MYASISNFPAFSATSVLSNTMDPTQSSLRTQRDLDSAFIRDLVAKNVDTFGCHLTAVSPCRHFKGNEGICEGNDEFYIDGSDIPTCNFLGTEDFFGFSWNWRELWGDTYSGTTFLSDTGGETKLACYRFLLNDPIRFSDSLKAQISYRHEVNNKPLQLAKAEGSGEVRFGIVSYWYQDQPVDANSV